MTPDQAVQNTDREIYRETPGDYYADSIHVTAGGGIGIRVGGNVVVKPLKDWHAGHVFEPFAETKSNVCKLLRDAWLILEDGPDDTDKARANDKIGEAMALARVACKEAPL